MKIKINLMPFLVSLALSLTLLTSCSLPDFTGADTQSKTSYDVSNDYFEYVSYKPSVLTNAQISTGETTREYAITITSKCELSLYEYTAEVKLYSSNNSVIKTQTVTKTVDVAANTNFDFYFDVTQSVQASTTSASVTYSGKSYENPKDLQKNCKITLVYNNGTANDTVKVKKGNTLSTPSDPKKTNYIFMGWYTDKALTKKYDFSQSVSGDFTLYAAYEIDAVTITNTVSTDTIKGVVKVYNKCYNTSIFNIETSYSVAQGSGFCFYISSNGYYYILTNCHVALADSNYKNQQITVEDYQGNTYNAYIYKNPNKNDKAIDPSYDLACIYFKPDSSDSCNVKALDIKSNPSVDDDVISLGAPEGQTNSITYGTVSAYKTVSLSNASADSSNVTFEVIEHSAYINSGSSGGPLLNGNLQVVGINYASNDKSQDTTVSRSYAIPAEKINEFLKTYVYN